VIKHALGSFGESYRYILKDKVSLILALIPIMIGIALYYFAGVKVFNAAMDFGQGYISEYLGDGTLGTVFNWIVKILLTILLYYIVNLTFIMIISIIASPFNDILSKRIESQVLKKELPTLNESFSGFFTKFFATVLTEIKKVIFILGLSLLIVILGFFPLLTPVSVILGAMVLSFEYLDFSWSRHEMPFKACRTDFRKNIFGYTIGGSFFILLISIPVINLIVPSFGTSYFTVLWVKNNELSR